MAESEQQKTFSDFTVSGDAGEDFSLEGAFEISNDAEVPTYNPSDGFESSAQAKAEPVPESNYDSDDDNDSDDESDEETDSEPGEDIAQLTQGMGQMMGGMVNGMMGGMVNGMMGGMLGGLMKKDSAMYRMTAMKYEALEVYMGEVDANKREVSAEDKAKYEKTLSILKSILEAYDKHEGNPMALNATITQLSKELEDTPGAYPPDIEIDDSELQAQMVGDLFGGMSNQENAECCVM